MSIAAALQHQSTPTDKRDQLVACAAMLGVAPEVLLAVRSRYWPACDVFEFAMEMGLDLAVLLKQLDRFLPYV